jgi:hypothetical protein
MTLQEIQDLAGHRDVPPWVVKLVGDVIVREREACAQIAIYGCMVPPDGGSPTEDERLLCEHIAHSIRARGEA